MACASLSCHEGGKRAAGSTQRIDAGATRGRLHWLHPRATLDDPAQRVGKLCDRRMREGRGGNQRISKISNVFPSQSIRSLVVHVTQTARRDGEDGEGKKNNNNGQNVAPRLMSEFTRWTGGVNSRERKKYDRRGPVA